jgi:hypothetical protein
VLGVGVGVAGEGLGVLRAAGVDGLAVGWLVGSAAAGALGARSVAVSATAVQRISADL